VEESEFDMTYKAMIVAIFLAAILLPQRAPSQEPARNDRKKPPATAAKDASPKANELAALQSSAQTFTDAFNRGDAKAVAALWTKDGDYVDELGQRYEGRDAIEKEYASFFAAHPGAKVTLVVDALRLVNDTTAIEDGRTTVETGDAAGSGYGKYTAMHVKVDGKWLMSSVRDTRLGDPSPANPLKDLDWLVGSWIAEQSDAKMQVVCRWIAGNSFLERSYSVKRSDLVVASGLQVIGWNPQAQRIQSWIFTSDGSHAVGLWSPRQDGWAVEAAGMLADGTPTRAVNLLARLDENAFSWKSIERSAGGVSLPETDEILLKRSVAKH
jgi:uncharacterized protein (TIGR02246 family)